MVTLKTYRSRATSPAKAPSVDNLRWTSAIPYVLFHLAAFAGVLRKAGLEVANRGYFLHVTGPERAGHDAATAAGTDAP